MNPLGSFLGIDPGLNGGIALITRDGITQVFRMPRTEADIELLFRSRLDPQNVAFCLLERVHSFPGAGVASMFTFGRNVGVLIGLLLAHGVPFEEIEPRTWQRALGIPPRIKRPRKPKPFMQYPPEESLSQWKNRLRSRARTLFPDTEITLYTADALLIAEVARRIRVGYQGGRAIA
jgi:crossover junction endodeoxyribonuclease RuvC